MVIGDSLETIRSEGVAGRKEYILRRPLPPALYPATAWRAALKEARISKAAVHDVSQQGSPGTCPSDTGFDRIALHLRITMFRH
jgi:hypothetical protein